MNGGLSVMRPAHGDEGVKLQDNKQSVDSWPIDPLVEGRHFYWEAGLMVFTEQYHLSRGYCCGSGCRHCPYEHAQVKQP
ncbi:MAG: hypothetical protein FHK82_08835 [Sedimenticola thiotaurini]|uniref:Uncharacterized protein n=1 Tax=Sedimenticola thiotaurini TaxID=1543721 RepID=A0A558D2M4_9GAMM|nr:MAG: hypothetical protein FHK82_08835 [Sedimenticola thiotaurini]